MFLPLRKIQKSAKRPKKRRYMKHAIGLTKQKTKQPTKEKNRTENQYGLFGDPDENRTRVTAVKGRCLNRLTTGPLVALTGFEPVTLRV